jgi:hypothetical protein
MIVGGWEYIRAAYIVTGLILSFYSISVILRYRAELEREKRTKETTE